MRKTGKSRRPSNSSVTRARLSKERKPDSQCTHTIFRDRQMPKMRGNRYESDSAETWCRGSPGPVDDILEGFGRSP